MKETEKILIVGGGLAGLCLAWQLEKIGHPFLLVTQRENASSVIAAGQINPMVFRRMTKSWRVDEFMPYLQQFYPEVEAKIGEQCYFPIPIRRAFSHQQERDQWIDRSKNESFQAYVKPISEADEEVDFMHHSCGTGVVLQTAYVSARNFVEKTRDYFESKGLLHYETFRYGDVDVKNRLWKGEEYKQIIFCEGFAGIHNPWFSNLPLETTKGEVLTIRSTDIPAKESLNRKCFLLPIGNQEFKLGATYTWKTANQELTAEAKEELTTHAHNLVKGSFEIIQHEAGIRPTVKDRRPLMGEHADYKGIFYFNGLGTKGYMLAPLLSEEMMHFMLDSKPLDSEVNIGRFL